MPNRIDSIAFDDAGGGNLLGGLVIGALHGRTYFSRTLGPEWFSFGSAIKAVISSAIIEMVCRAGSPPRVVLCRTDLFHRTAADLQRLGFTVERTVIDGELQKRTEEDFFLHLRELGLPAHINRMFPHDDAEKNRCYRSLNEWCAAYLLAHPEARRQAAKANCCLLRQLLEADVERAYCDRVSGRPKRCVECGEVVSRGSAWRLEGAGRVFYVHEGCEPWVS